MMRMRRIMVRKRKLEARGGICRELFPENLSLNGSHPRKKKKKKEEQEQDREGKSNKMEVRKMEILEINYDFEMVRIYEF
jgi:hypothetical protein